MKRILLGLAGAALVVAAGRAAGPVTFVDVTARAGIKFQHYSGASGKKYMPETFGSGAVFFDADGDGWQDIFLVNSSRIPGEPGRVTLSSLYRNRGDGTFLDITQGSGLDVELYALGAAAADYDNDGRADLFVSGYNSARLFHNDGGGRFRDVSKAAGVVVRGFSTAALWFDYDKDGALDLLVGRYVEWTPATDLRCTMDGKSKSYCTPDSYTGMPPMLFRNRRTGTFEDVSRRAGLAEQSAISAGSTFVLPRTLKTLGLAMLDFDADGWMDVFVANDTHPNSLFRNNGDGTFTDVAGRAGVAVTEMGIARAGMGVDAIDYDGSGRPGVVVGYFSNEMMGLYHNEGKGLFIDDAPASGIGAASLMTLTFGCFFFDYDLDGRPDIFATNGHVVDDIERVQPNVKYRQPPHLFRNLGQKKFTDAIKDVGPELARAVVGRGAAYADIDRDGDLDLLISTSMGPAYLYRNDGGNSNNVLRVRAEGTTSNRDAIGTRVDVRLAGGRTLWQVVKTGSSYLSQSELPLTFGLGTATGVESVRVTWPSGKVDSIGPTPANQVITVTEGAGVSRAQPLARAGR